MATAPLPFTGTRSDNPTTPTVGQTVMGWNQLVYITGNSAQLGLGSGPLRVEEYGIGINQTGDAPDYVTGRQDRTAWTKGPIETQGDLTFPFTFSTGIGMFSAGSLLVFNPQSSFDIQSSAHPRIGGCKVNSVTLSVNAGEPVRVNAQVWGIASTLENDFVTPAFGSGGLTNLESISSADGNDAARTLGVNFANPAGIQTAGASFPAGGDLILEQIPQWDVVEVVGAPDGMHVVGVSLTVENNLQRNYTMGDNTGASPFGLNATTITANQRRVSGTITWQSNMTGTIAQILGVGLESLRITIYGPSGNAVMLMSNCLWNAQPPRLSTGDRVTVESSFTALGANVQEFDAMVLTGPGIPVL